MFVYGASELKYLYTLKNANRIDKYYSDNIFYDSYILVRNTKLKELKMQNDEVSNVKYMYYKDVGKLVKNKDSELVPNFEDDKRIFKVVEKI